jgi:hypothetical protein
MTNIKDCLNNFIMAQKDIPIEFNRIISENFWKLTDNNIKMEKQTKFKVGDKAYKPKGYKFPCTIVSVFETVEGNVRVVGEMDQYGLLHIFNEDQLEHLPILDPWPGLGGC